MKQLYERGQGLVCVSFAMVTVVKRVSRRKKFISLLLALVMALSLMACGSKNNTDDTQITGGGCGICMGVCQIGAERHAMRGRYSRQCPVS